MSKKNQVFLNIVMVGLSWLSLFTIGRSNLKRFAPATLIISIIEIINAIMGKKRKWWVFYNKPNKYLFGEFPFNIGPFVLTSFFTLKFAYGNFSKFMIITAIIHAIFVFPISFVAKKLKLYTLVRINNGYFFLYFLLKAPILYFLQFLFEKFNTKSVEN
ncbi:hypothetical protein [Bacillus sp. B1-b2]|uniref:hypothetical protein n=1 Tax=Bacillus sp. B1-b2 TaxID=2653201 RepID=UPI001262A5D7|nr:hypothetical protein [Bacillus sp. B1-b2]KAB7665633.1 hypothetical protein F9279_20005 [Bacillus sp. B1-b2]